jgi:glycine cleavage system H protein
MNFPADLRYTREHEWVRIEGEVATIGITEYAQGELGDIVFVELPAVNSTTAQMQSFGTIEAVKTVSDLYAPLSGTVIEVNSKLADHAELINQDPYGGLDHQTEDFDQRRNQLCFRRKSIRSCWPDLRSTKAASWRPAFPLTNLRAGGVFKNSPTDESSPADKTATAGLNSAVGKL